MRKEATYINPGMFQDLDSRKSLINVNQQHHGDQFL